jgi:hypothetical protein
VNTLRTFVQLEPESHQRASSETPPAWTSPEKSASFESVQLLSPRQRIDRELLTGHSEIARGMRAGERTAAARLASHRLTMKNSALNYMHRLLAESLYRGYSGRRPSHQEATVLAAHSVRWFRELLLRLSIQTCIEEVDPISDPFDEKCSFESFEGFKCGTESLDGFALFDRDKREPSLQQDAIHSRDEALWDALCEGRLVLRIDGSEVNASVVPRTPPSVVH